MGKAGAYLEQGRVAHGERPEAEAILDFKEFALPLSEEERRAQASRCMMCGVAFCQFGESFGQARASGCPLHNLIPEWNDLVYRGLWSEAAERMALTNPFPEFTGRVCPALCEAACNLGRNAEPETIHDNERAISDHEWAAGGPRRFAPAAADAPRVCVVGSGPAGLVAAWDLARRGARVCVVERHDRAGGLLMYGIPNMKLDKAIVRRRTDLMAELGIEFRLGVDAADPAVAAALADEFDAVVLAVGAGAARGVRADGFARGLEAGSVVYAVDYLTQATHALLDGGEPAVSAAGKDVVVIGGGDTGNDCMGTAVRQGARSVRQLEYGLRAPEQRTAANQWPEWPNVRKTDYGQEEAIALQGEDLREWQADTRELLFDEAGALRGLRVQKLDWGTGKPVGVEDGAREVPAQLVLVACGFSGPERGVLDAFGVPVATEGLPLPVMAAPDSHRAARAVASGDAAAGGVAGAVSTTGAPSASIYVAGDARNGSSLVVNAMADALKCTAEVADDLGL